MAKQIEMNYKLESGYEVLYPNVILNSVTDWTNSIYSKSEIDDKIASATQIPAGWEELGVFNGYTGSQSGYGEIDNTITTNLQVEKQYEYTAVINLSATITGARDEEGSLSYSVCGTQVFRNDNLRSGINDSIKIVDALITIRQITIFSSESGNTQGALIIVIKGLRSQVVVLQNMIL